VVENSLLTRTIENPEEGEYFIGDITGAGSVSIQNNTFENLS
jgi:hypothetical protein